MYALKDRGTENAKTITIEQACARYGLGRGSVRKITAAAGAEIKIGRRVLINVSRVDEYLDALSGQSQE